MPDIFLSYASHDREVTRRFAKAFEAEGFSVWWDSALRSGEAYDERIETALRTARSVVVLWSKTSVESRWVRAEATLADRNRTLAPCLIEPCERPIMFELTHTADLCHWRGDRRDKAWRSFVGDIRRITEGKRRPAQEPIAAAPPTVKETTRPDKKGSAPSLAVLPFTNRSHLEEDEVFAEGMVEDVISALAQGANVRVLGSMATAAFRKGAITDIAAVGEQLGVRYLLEGNIRRVGESLRVTTQLLEADTGAVLWTARFDRPLSELARLQEQLVLEVAANLDAQVHTLEMERVLKKPDDLTAWEAMFRSFAAIRQRVDHETISVAVEEAERAVAIAPDYGPGHGQLASSLGLRYMAAGLEDPAEVARIREIVERADALGSYDAMVQTTVAQALCYIGAPKEAIHHSAQAIRKAPGHAWAHCSHAMACSMLNRTDEALASLATASRLMPGQSWLFGVKIWQANALIRAGRWEEAEAAYDECLAINPDLSLGWRHKAVIAWKLGHQQEARNLYIRLKAEGEWPDSTEAFLRRGFLNSPNLDELIDIVRSIEAA